MSEFEFTTKTDFVAEFLRSEIVRGSLRAGSQLRQDEVARRLHVSPTPVREAFGILEAEGFVERRPHRGVVVTAMDAGMIDDAYALRNLVEGFAVKRAASVIRRRPGEVRNMEEALEQCAAALKAGSIQRFRSASRAFHRALVAAAGSDVLDQLHSVLMRKTVFNVQLDKNEMDRYHKAHSRIFRAIVAGDGEAAAELLAITCTAWRRKDHRNSPRTPSAKRVRTLETPADARSTLAKVRSTTRRG